MRAFVTGGAGFLGQQVVKGLLAHGHHVVCLLRTRSNAEGLRGMSTTSDRGRLELVRGTLGQPESYREALAGCDVVFHLAAEMRGAVAVLFMTNVVATRAFLEASRRAGVGRFVLVSSFGVYGTAGVQRHGVLDESCALDPQPHLRDPYSYSKIAEEHVAWRAHREAGLPLVVVRPGVIYGPGRDWVSSRVGLRLGNTVIKMGGRQIVPYTYVDNCADAVHRAGVVPGIEGHAFNVVDDHLPTANGLLRYYRRHVRRLRVIPVPGWAIGPLSGACQWYHDYSRGQLPAVISPYRSAAMWKPLRYSNDKARRMLAWQPAVSFADGLARTARSLSGGPN